MAAKEKNDGMSFDLSLALDAQRLRLLRKNLEKKKLSLEEILAAHIRNEYTKQVPKASRETMDFVCGELPPLKKSSDETPAAEENVGSESSLS